jgi:hypothetical protein
MGFLFFYFSFKSKGERFGGALDGAAKQFSEAYDAGLNPMDFVNKMRKEGKLIMGIGHRVKSVSFWEKFVFVFLTVYFILKA